MILLILNFFFNTLICYIGLYAIGIGLNNKFLCTSIHEISYIITYLYMFSLDWIKIIRLRSLELTEFFVCNKFNDQEFDLELEIKLISGHIFFFIVYNLGYSLKDPNRYFRIENIIILFFIILQEITAVNENGITHTLLLYTCLFNICMFIIKFILITFQLLKGKIVLMIFRSVEWIWNICLVWKFIFINDFCPWYLIMWLSLLPYILPMKQNVNVVNEENFLHAKPFKMMNSLLLLNQLNKENFLIKNMEENE